MPVPAILASAGRVVGQCFGKGKPPAGGPPKPGAQPQTPQANGKKPGPDGQQTPHDFAADQHQKHTSNTWDKINAGTGVLSVGMMVPGMMPGGNQPPGGENQPGGEGKGRPRHTPVGSDTY